MGPDAHVDIVALLIECDASVCRQIANVLNLIRLSSAGHELNGLRTWQLEGRDLLICLGYLVHLLLDGRKVLF